MFAQTMAVNQGSRATMTSLGLRFVRTFFPHVDDPLPRTEEGEVEYELLAEQWRQRG